MISSLLTTTKGIEYIITVVALAAFLVFLRFLKERGDNRST